MPNVNTIISNTSIGNVFYVVCIPYSWPDTPLYV